MEAFLTLLGIMAAAAVGFYFGRNHSSDAKEKKRMESELKEKKEELEAFRNKVTNHFEKTANLFNQVSDSYQSLYEHMATSSNQLCAKPPFQPLPQQVDRKEETTLSPENKTNINETDIFDADNLYNAHDYRNHQRTSDVKSGEVKSTDNDKVVNFESAKDENKEPALDYAIKEKGIVNHNSLNIDGIKTS